MKKILIVDFLFVQAHNDFNKNIIECFAKYNKVTVLDVNNYYYSERELWERNGVKVISKSLKLKKTGAFMSRLYSLVLMKMAEKQYHEGSYDLMVTLAYDTFAFAIGRTFMKGIPVALFNHKNIDELGSSLKLKAFNTFKNRTYHFVFENFIKSFLVEQNGVDIDKCFVIPHPVKFRAISKEGSKKNYDCVGLSNSNSEEFIDAMLQLNEEYKKNGIFILLRSKLKRQSKSNIKIINGFLDYKSYNNYLDKANKVIVPVPAAYSYRASGAIYDAFSRKKIVLTTSKLYSLDYRKRYPGICFGISSAQDVIDRLKEREHKIQQNQSFNSFLSEHDIQVVANTINQVVEYISKGRIRKKM